MESTALTPRSPNSQRIRLADPTPVGELSPFANLGESSLRTELGCNPLPTTPTTALEAPHEANLVRRDEEFGALFRLQYSAMVKLSRRVVFNESVAEEVVQDAFAELYERWRLVEQPLGYLRMMVLNRSRRVVRRRIHGNELYEEIGRQPDTSAEVHYVLDLLGRLDQRHRTAVFLAYFAAMSRAEIGEALGCSESAAKSLVWRGLDQLRRELSVR